MSGIAAKLKEEFLKVIPPTVFFFVALHLIALVRSLMLSQTGITLPATMSLTIAALILGKAVLLADMLPFINRFPERPLIYNVLWKTAIYLLVTAVIHYLERLSHFASEVGGVAAGNRLLLEQMVWPHFWAIQILMLVLILMYCATRELVRVIGRDKVLSMFFGPMSVEAGPNR